MEYLVEMGMRIKQLRQRLNLTQEELAQKAGYTSRSSINKIEKGLVDIPQSKVADLADALGTTPAYLMGWENSNYRIGDRAAKSLAKNIKLYREKAEISAQDMADLLGLDEKTFLSIERAEYKLDKETIFNICDILHITPDFLDGIITERLDEGDIDAEYCYTRIIDHHRSPPHRVPVLGYVAAGIPISAVEDIIDYEELAPDMVKDGAEYFALQIKGQSMEPKISDGDVVIVRKQPDVDSGQIAIVCVNGDEATCKKIMKQDNGILLLPLNPAFAPTFYSNENIESIPITILGRVVELRAKF